MTRRTFWDWLFCRRRPPLFVPIQQTPEEKARFLRECEDAYLRASGEGDCQWHGRYNGEVTGCCVHHRILSRRGGVP